MIARRRAITGAGAAAAAALATLTTVPARAQDTTFYLDRIQISGAPDDGFAVWRPRVYQKKTRFYGMAALGFAHNTLRKGTVTNNAHALQVLDHLVSNQLITYLFAGTEIGGKLGLGVSLPIAFWQGGGDLNQYSMERVGAFDRRNVALHDLRFDARLPLYHSNSGKFHWGLGGALWLPTGNQYAFTGDNQITGYPYTALEFDFDKFFLAGMLGPQFRPTRGSSQPNNSLFIGSELRWALGGYIPLRQNKYQLGLELFGNTGITEIRGQSKFFAGSNTDLEWLAQGRMALDQDKQVWAMAGFGTRLTDGYGGPDFRILASIGYWFGLKDTNPKAPARRWRAPPEVERESDRDGDGYPDNIDKCPDIKEDGQPPDPSDGCPAGADRDGDGIPDEADKCPDTPEDKDGIEDADGCPEKDADNDGIPDEEDKCPTEPGPASKIAEKHGCPQLTKVTSDGDIQLLEPIQFDFNKATIKPVSFPILDEVVQLMKSRAGIRVGIYGHTDSQGGDDYNLRLSKSRARSCLEYITGKGIAANRLESEGFGESKPVDTNDTPEGRAKNRRVDFKILNAD
jgi:outer membrane protein OmpA-like peptidoglycan-associated protein